ncbi:hypothetical protein GGR58DRAFT_495102 [Xylaria digitata]|nr:hypothetical protein GGR58DRAFT_495102 [Xylaria digitata]
MANPVESRPLPATADAEVENLATWLRSDEADFQTVDQIRICKNTDGLSGATSKLSALFRDEIKGRLSNGLVKTRVTALHFENPTAVPLEPGWIMELIPIHIVEGAVEVGDQQHTPSSYFHLTAQARVSGNFFAVLLLSRIA